MCDEMNERIYSDFIKPPVVSTKYFNVTGSAVIELGV